MTAEVKNIPPVPAAPKPAEDGNAKCWCKLVSKTLRVSSALVANDAFSIGRAAGNNMQIKDTRISGTHCVILRAKKPGSELGEYFVEDRSTNGTYLNGSKVVRGLGHAG